MEVCDVADTQDNNDVKMSNVETEGNQIFAMRWLLQISIVKDQCLEKCNDVFTIK